LQGAAQAAGAAADIQHARLRGAADKVDNFRPLLAIIIGRLYKWCCTGSFFLLHALKIQCMLWIKIFFWMFYWRAEKFCD
jgi:hypothetical protein